MQAPKHTNDTIEHQPRGRRSRINQPIWRSDGRAGAGIKPMNPAPVESDHSTSSASTVSLQEYLLKERERLLRSNLELEHFATLAAHDLKSPIHAAFSWLNILNEQIPQSDFATISHSIDIINRNLRNAITYVNELLRISKAKETQTKFETCDMNKIVCEVLNVHAQSLENIRASVKCHTLPSTTGNRQQLECVFSNLIGNSIKYMHPDRILEINIGAKSSDSSIEYFVQDNGIGIPSSRLNDIFNLFESFSTPPGEHSNGIGLAFCRKVIDLHGGRIWAESSDNLGSKIIFLLPKRAHS